MMAFAVMANATVYYVSSTATGTGTGTSWANAFLSPAAAIASATPQAGDEFWVKQGTYVSATQLTWETGQHFYGGFLGTETLRSQRSTDATLTILEGNNTNRVLNAPSMASATTWDGFTIQKGTAATGAGAFLQKNAILSNCIFQNNTAANAVSTYVAAGGGIYIQGGAADADSIKVLNCTIKNNVVKTVAIASNYCGGGGIYIKAGSIKAVVKGCTIESNTADGLGTANAIVSGGGIYMCDGTIDGSTIKNNVVTNANPTTFVVTNAKNQGGGIFIMPQASTSTIVKNSTISGNSAPTYVGGGMSIDPLYSSTVVTGKVSILNTFITNNSTRGAGGGVMTNALNAGSTSEYVFNNCVIANNESSTVAAGGGGVFINNILGTNVSPTVNNSVKFANCTVVNNKMLTTNYGGAGIFYNNISADITNCVFWGNASVGALAPYNVRVKNTLTTNKLINCAFDSRFVDLEVSPVATPADLTGKVIVSLNNTGSTGGTFYPNFTSPTNFTGKAVTADNITNLAAADWSISTASAGYNTGTTVASVTTDIKGLTRPQGSAYDIGAYEFNVSATLDATTAITVIRATTATSGGNITSEGGATVTRGVCWSAATSTPTIDVNAKSTNGTGLGIFTSNLSGLTPNTRYYVRAYATNSFGTVYGAAVNFYTDPLVTYTSGWPKVENVTSSSFTAKANLNVAGISYYVVLPSGATAPTSAQVKAGQNAAGSAVTSGSISCTNATTEYTASISSLTVATTYDLYFVAENAAGNNLQASPTLVSATTLQTYSISASSGSGGSITSGTGTYDSGATATLVATADAGYSFINWTLDTSGGAEQSTLASYPFTVSGAKTLVANFVANAVSVSTAQLASALTLTAASDITVVNGGTLTLDANLTTVNSITIEKGGKVTNNANKSLIANSFTINSNASGTGTYVDKGTSTITTATVNQWLTAGRNYFISSPVTTATGSVILGANGLSGNSLWQYNEENANWLDATSKNTDLTVMRGFVAKKTGSDGVISFTGTLNTLASLSPITIYRTDNSNASRGFNIVGNPFPCYVDWDLASTTNLETTIWYRTKTTPELETLATTYVFDTYNKTGSKHTSLGATSVSNLIPPMQSFWVRVSTIGSGILTFDNSNALVHADVSTNSFKAPVVEKSTQKVLKLVVSNGKNKDEAIIYFDVNASDNYDAYDSPKMTNSNTAIPEIYTTVGNEQLVINGLNNVVENKELALGFNTGSANNFTIKASEVCNFDADTKIILKDNLMNSQYDLTGGSAYNFSSDATNTTTRFTVIFKSTTVANEIKDYNYTDSSVNIFMNANNQITINRSIPQEGIITVCNTIGQKLLSTKTTGTSTVIKKSLRSGVYFVTHNAAGNKSLKKVIIN